jgi:lysyl-tRNA synthetase class 2
MKTWQKIKQHPEALYPFKVREKVIDATRAYFKGAGFMEVETPKLLPQPSTEPFLEVFQTELKFEEGDTHTAFLPSSPEFALKKLLAGGVGNVFEICKSFRNGEGRSSRHNPEFTILEWYHTLADYFDVMHDCEALFQHIHNAVYGSAQKNFALPYQGKTYSLQSPWERITVAEAFQKYSDIDVETLLCENKLLTVGKKKGYTVTGETTWEEMFYQIMFNEIEPHLGTNTPTFLYEYPASQAALARKKPTDPRFAERFEVFLAGFELGNAFTELTDAKEQRARCEVDLAMRKKLGKTAFGMDEDFLAALESGIPPTGGIAMGMDRIAAIFADVARIQDTLFFPIDELFPRVF